MASFTGKPQETAESPIRGSTVTSFRSTLPKRSDRNAPSSDPWNLNRSLRDLISVDVHTGSFIPIVHGRRIESYRLSPDGSRVAYTVPTRFEKAGSQQILFDFAITSALGAAPERILASNFRLDYGGSSFSWSPDGMFLGLHAGGMEERTADCYLINTRTGTIRNVTKFDPLEQQHYKTFAPLWDAGGNVYMIQDGALWRSSFDEPKAVAVGQVRGREIRQALSKSDHTLWSIDCWQVGCSTYT